MGRHWNAVERNKLNVIAAGSESLDDFVSKIEACAEMHPMRTLGAYLGALSGVNIPDALREQLRKHVLDERRLVDGDGGEAKEVAFPPPAGPELEAMIERIRALAKGRTLAQAGRALSLSDSYIPSLISRMRAGKPVHPSTVDRLSKRAGHAYTYLRTGAPPPDDQGAPLPTAVASPAAAAPAPTPPVVAPTMPTTTAATATPVPQLWLAAATAAQLFGISEKTCLDNTQHFPRRDSGGNAGYLVDVLPSLNRLRELALLSKNDRAMRNSSRSTLERFCVRYRLDVAGALATLEEIVRAARTNSTGAAGHVLALLDREEGGEPDSPDAPDQPTAATVEPVTTSAAPAADDAFTTRVAWVLDGLKQDALSPDEARQLLAEKTK